MSGLFLQKAFKNLERLYFELNPMKIIVSFFMVIVKVLERGEFEVKL